MKIVKIVTLCLFSAVLLLAGHGQSFAQSKPWQAITPTRIMIADPTAPNPLPPTTGNQALKNATLLQKALDSYQPSHPPYPGKLGALIKKLKREYNVGLRGLGGVPGYGLIDAAEGTLLNDNFDPKKEVSISVSGQILDYEFIRNGSSMYGKGRIVSATYITRTIKPKNGKGKTVTKTEAFKWEVTVKEGGFEVHKKVDSVNPFPGTIPFTPAMIDRINKLKFKYKLFAKGADSIKIEKVWHKNNASAGNWGQPIKKTHKLYGGLYDQLAENCIDMLFVDFPPKELGTMGPPLYCLGRCAKPLLVNTGM